MSSLEMELQRVTTDIAAARSRLSAARLSNNLTLVQALEEAIAVAEARRAALRAGGVAAIEDGAEPAADPAPEPDLQPDPEPEPVEGVAAVEDAQPNDAEIAEPQVASEGVAAMSDEIVPIDAIERASRQLEARRAEMLARHADELKELDADQKEIDAMAQAMSAFLRKFNLGSAAGSVVRLDDERDMRLQSHG
ncbi:MAG TPA: hypothetical protein VGQ90_08980 [Stellaceae bacterium]|nr:hypothetical protein [Stellaceae bacterium]